MCSKVKAAQRGTGHMAQGTTIDRLAITYFYTARASSAEVLTQAIIAVEIGYLGEDSFRYIENECEAISSMLTRLIRARLRS